MHRSNCQWYMNYFNSINHHPLNCDFMQTQFLRSRAYKRSALNLMPFRLTWFSQPTLQWIKCCCCLNNPRSKNWISNQLQQSYKSSIYMHDANCHEANSWSDLRFRLSSSSFVALRYWLQSPKPGKSRLNLQKIIYTQDISQQCPRPPLRSKYKSTIINIEKEKKKKPKDKNSLDI